MRGVVAKKLGTIVGRPWVNLARFGCANRPFYLLCVFPPRSYGRQWEGLILEQIGTFDPVPNSNNEKLVSLNVARIRYWLAKNALVSSSALQLLGLSGLLPIHPLTYIRARHNRHRRPLIPLGEGEGEAEKGSYLQEEGDTPSQPSLVAES